MSQSATLYRISIETFQVIEKMEARHIKPSDISEGSVTFQGSFVGLEFILSKGLDEDGRETIGEIFNPIRFIGPNDTHIFSLDLEEEEFAEPDAAAGYLTPKKVRKTYELLSTISDSAVAEGFHAGELNENNIYPFCWQDGEEEDQAFNRRHILQDLDALRDFFCRATENEDYILSYVG